MMPARFRVARAMRCLSSFRGNAEIISSNADDGRLRKLGNHVDPAVGTGYSLAALVGHGFPDCLRINFSLDDTLKKLPFACVLLAPVNRHDERAPWHPGLNRFAEREIIEAPEDLSNIVHLGEDHEFAEDRDGAHTAKQREDEFEKPEM